MECFYQREFNKLVKRCFLVLEKESKCLNSDRLQAFVISLDKANSFQAFSRMYLIRWVAFTATDTRSLNVKNGKLSILRSSNVRTVSRNGNCNLFRNKPNSQQPTWFQPPICHFLLLSPSFFFLRFRHVLAPFPISVCIIFLPVMQPLWLESYFVTFTEIGMIV